MNFRSISSLSQSKLWASLFFCFVFAGRPVWANPACIDIFTGVTRYQEFGVIVAPGVTLSKVDPPSIATDGRVSSQNWYDHYGEEHARTGRTLAQLEKDFFRGGELSSENIREKRILDAGTGTGRLVEDLLDKNRNEELGLYAEGIDLVISEEMELSGHFHAMDMRRTSYKDGEWDLIISTASLFTHGPHEAIGIVGDGVKGHPNYGKKTTLKRKAQEDVLREFKRICSAKCIVLIADVSLKVKEIAEAVGFNAEFYGNYVLRLTLDNSSH